MFIEEIKQDGYKCIRIGGTIRPKKMKNVIMKVLPYNGETVPALGAWEAAEGESLSAVKEKCKCGCESATKFEFTKDAGWQIKLIGVVKCNWCGCELYRTSKTIW